MSNLVGRYVPPTVTEQRNAVKVAHPQSPGRVGRACRIFVAAPGTQSRWPAEPCGLVQWAARAGTDKETARTEGLAEKCVTTVPAS